MRPILHGDVSSAARVLLRVGPGQRKRLCRRLIIEAEMADAHVRAHGTVHPLFGNGSLMASARQRALAREPSFDDSEYCDCFILVLSELLAHRASGR